jgi:hypothetical protein
MRAPESFATLRIAEAHETGVRHRSLNINPIFPHVPGA